MDYTYYDYDALGGLYAGVMIFSVIVCILQIVGLWKIFNKAGKPGWASIIPIYNIIILLQIVKMDWWHILIMLFVPFATVVYAFIIYIKLAEAFGKTTGFGVLTAFFPYLCLLILGFGKVGYQGANNQFSNDVPNNQEFVPEQNNSFDQNEENQIVDNNNYSNEQSQPDSIVNNVFFGKSKPELEPEPNKDIYKDGPSKTTFEVDPNIATTVPEDDQFQDLQEKNLEQYQPNGFETPIEQPQNPNENVNQNEQF